jgi:hypothetical protein
LYVVVERYGPRQLHDDHDRAVSELEHAWPRSLSITRRTNVVLLRHPWIVLPFGIAATANPPTTAAVTRHDTTATRTRERIPAPLLTLCGQDTGLTADTSRSVPACIAPLGSFRQNYRPVISSRVTNGGEHDTAEFLERVVRAIDTA